MITNYFQGKKEREKKKRKKKEIRGGGTTKEKKKWWPAALSHKEERGKITSTALQGSRKTGREA